MGSGNITAPHTSRVSFHPRRSIRKVATGKVECYRTWNGDWTARIRDGLISSVRTVAKENFSPVAMLSTSSKDKDDDNGTHQCPNVASDCSTVLLGEDYCLYYVEDELLKPIRTLTRTHSFLAMRSILRNAMVHTTAMVRWGSSRCSSVRLIPSMRSPNAVTHVTFNPERAHNSGDDDDGGDSSDDGDDSSIHYPCAWCLHHKQSCPSTRVFSCMLQRGGGRWNEDGTIIMALWNTVIALSYANLSILISNTTVLLFVRIIIRSSARRLFWLNRSGSSSVNVCCSLCTDFMRCCRVTRWTGHWAKLRGSGGIDAHL